MIRFPSFVAKTIDGQERPFPGVLNGKLGIVHVAFRREHSKTGDSWSRALRLAKQRNIPIHVVLVMGEQNRMLKWALSKVFSAKFTRQEQREVTSILWEKKDKIIADLQLPDDSEADLCVVDGQGVVAWHQRGDYTPEKGRAFFQAVFPAEEVEAAVAEVEKQAGVENAWQ